MRGQLLRLNNNCARLPRVQQGRDGGGVSTTMTRRGCLYEFGGMGVCMCGARARTRDTRHELHSGSENACERMGYPSQIVGGPRDEWFCAILWRWSLQVGVWISSSLLRVALDRRRQEFDEGCHDECAPLMRFRVPREPGAGGAKRLPSTNRPGHWAQVPRTGLPRR